VLPLVLQILGQLLTRIQWTGRVKSGEMNKQAKKMVAPDRSAQSARKRSNESQEQAFQLVSTQPKTASPYRQRLLKPSRARKGHMLAVASPLPLAGWAESVQVGPGRSPDLVLPAALRLLQLDSWTRTCGGLASDFGICFKVPVRLQPEQAG
jgi:hypothetical protein